MEKEITIYASKKSYTKDGENKDFYIYSTRLIDKDNNDKYFQVKFKESECAKPAPAKCPMNIIVKKEDCNIQTKSRKHINKEGEEKEVEDNILWISNWKEGSPYVDTSTDAYF